MACISVEWETYNVGTYYDIHVQQFALTLQKIVKRLVHTKFTQALEMGYIHMSVDFARSVYTLASSTQKLKVCALMDCSLTILEWCYVNDEVKSPTSSQQTMQRFLSYRHLAQVQCTAVWTDLAKHCEKVVQTNLCTESKAKSIKMVHIDRHI